MTKNQHGGLRPGAGRHPKLTNPRRVTIWLEGEQFAWINTQQGDKSQVIRRLITAAMEKDN